MTPRKDKVLHQLHELLKVYCAPVKREVYDCIYTHGSNHPITYGRISEATGHDLKEVAKAVNALDRSGLITKMSYVGGDANSEVLINRSKSYRLLERVKEIQVA